MGEINWNGVSSRSIPIVIENPPSYTSPERDYDVNHILGRNGDLLIENGSFKNVERSYDIAFGSYEKTHSEMASAVSEWLRSASGYARLEDSYDPDVYRRAYYQEETDIENVLNHLGRATITFNCMPQRFLKSGETKVTIRTSGGKLRNPTSFSSYPLITLPYPEEGDTLTVNDTTYIFAKTIMFEEMLTLDSELGEVYGYMRRYNTYYDQNDSVKWENEYVHSFPELHPGENTISFTGRIKYVEVIPRWWIL